MTNTLQTYSSLSNINELSKKDLQALAKAQINEILDADSPEIAFAFLHKITTLCDTVKKGIMEAAITEVEKGNNHAFGIKMAIANKSTYDYSNNELYNKLKEQLETHTEFLKKLKTKITEVDDETGEITVHYPPLKKVSTYIKSEF